MGLLNDRLCEKQSNTNVGVLNPNKSREYLSTGAQLSNTTPPVHTDPRVDLGWVYLDENMP